MTPSILKYELQFSRWSSLLLEQSVKSAKLSWQYSNDICHEVIVRSKRKLSVSIFINFVCCNDFMPTTATSFFTSIAESGHWLDNTPGRHQNASHSKIRRTVDLKRAHWAQFSYTRRSRMHNWISPYDIAADFPAEPLTRGQHYIEWESLWYWWLPR